MTLRDDVLDEGCVLVVSADDGVLTVALDDLVVLPTYEREGLVRIGQWSCGLTMNQS